MVSCSVVPTFHAVVRSFQVRGEVTAARLDNVRERGDAERALTAARAMSVEIDPYVGRTADVAFAGDASAGPHSSVLRCLNDDDLVIFTVRFELVELTKLVPVYAHATHRLVVVVVSRQMAMFIVITVKPSRKFTWFI